MKKIISMLLALALMVGCVSILSSCGAPEDDGAEIDIYLGSQIYDLDPSDYYVNSNVEAVMSLLFEPLFRINEAGNLENAQAENYTVDKESRTIVITLRESYWSNDARVYASDFIYAWQRILDPNNPNPAAPLFYDIENAAAAKSGSSSLFDVEAKATGTYEITIKYREGADYNNLLKNLASIATSPVRQSNVESSPNYWSKFVNSAAFNGPFKVQAINSITSEMTLARNKGYHQAPNIVDYDNVVTPGKLIGLYTAYGEEVAVSYKDIQDKTVFYLMDAPLSDRTANKGSSTAKDDTSVYSYVFNVENPLFKNAKVRQALSLVIDRNAIVSAIAFGKAADGLLPDVSGGSSAALISSSAKIAEAEALLDSVEGFDKMNKSFTLSVDYDAESLAVAELVKAAWEGLGFKVKVEAVKPIETTIAAESEDSDDVVFEDSGIQVLAKEASYGNRDFDVLAIDLQTYSKDAFVALAGFSTALNGCGVDFVTGSSRKNISGWSSIEYDMLINQAYKATGDERKAILAEAEKLLCEEAPVIPLVFNQNFAFVSSELSGVKYDGLGNIILTGVSQKNYKNYLED